MNKENKGLVYSSVDDHIDEIKIKNYQATENSTDRICILNAKSKLIVRFHYVDGLGYIYCWDGACCKKYGSSIIRNIYPIVKYPTTKDGELTKGSVELLRLTLNNVKDSSIRIKNKIEIQKGRNIADVDLLFVGGEKQTIENSNRTYVDYSIEGPISDASWKTNNSWKQELKESWDFYKENIEGVIAKFIGNDEEFYKLLQSTKDQKQSNRQYTSNTELKENQKAVPDNSSTISEDTDIDDMFESKNNNNNNNKKLVDSNSNDDDFNMFNQ